MAHKAKTHPTPFFYYFNVFVRFYTYLCVMLQIKHNTGKPVCVKIIPGLQRTQDPAGGRNPWGKFTMPMTGMR